MTNTEKQEIIDAVLAALATNSKTIAQLSPKTSLADSDLFEVAGGSRVTYAVLYALLRDGVALQSQLSNYVTGDAATLYLAKLDTDTGTIDFKESPCVMLDGFKDVNGYTPAVGDLYYENLHGYQIWTKTAGGATGEYANTHVAYINKNDGGIYRWTGTTMVRIGGPVVINDLTTGGEGDALSAEMGKWLYTNLYTIFTQLGNYAFPNGKPQIDWGGGNPPVIPPCTVSKTIGAGLSSTGGDSDVAFGDPLEVSIAITDNLYIVDDDSVVVTMGGSPVQGAWNASTMKVNIAAVTGDVVINIPSLTYVGYGEQNSPLVLHLDGKNMGSTANQWRNLCNENKPLVLSGGYTKNSDGVTFNGTDGTGKIENLGVDLPWLESALEAVYKQSDTTSPQVIALSGNVYNSVLCHSYTADNKVSSNNGTFPDGGSGLSGAYSIFLSMTRTMPYSSNTTVHLVNNGGNDHYLNNVALEKGTTPGVGFGNYVGISTSTHNNAGEFWVSGYVGRAGSYFGPLKGTVYAVRAYNRVLTTAELAQNHKVDKKRFNIA